MMEWTFGRVIAFIIQTLIGSLPVLLIWYADRVPAFFKKLSRLMRSGR